MTDLVELETAHSLPDYSNYKLRAFSEAISSGVLTPDLSQRFGTNFSVSIDKAKAALSPFIRPTIEPTSITELTGEESKIAFRKVVKSFVDHGIIDTNTAQLTGKLVRPSDLKQIEQSYFRFLYNDEEFPESPEDRADLEMGSLAFQTHSNNLAEKLRRIGVTLSPAEHREVVLRWLISHEYGHAVDQALQIDKGATASISQPNTPRWKLLADIDHQLSQNLLTNIAPEPKLQEMFASSDDSLQYSKAVDTSSERVSTGFEYLGLTYALQDVGVFGDNIEKVLQAFKEDDEVSFGVFKDLIAKAATKGMGIEEVGVALNTLKIELRNANETELLKTLPTHFGASYAGYYFPLDENELKSYLASFKEH